MREIKLSLILFSLLFVLVFASSCGEEWYYTDLMLENKLEDQVPIVTTIEGRKTTVDFAERKVIYTFDPQKSGGEEKNLDVFIEVGDYSFSTYVPLTTHKDSPGQVLLVLYRQGEQVVIDRKDIVY